jgi:tripartite-type tricarboxylate transporter receptor subunit TctC
MRLRFALGFALLAASALPATGQDYFAGKSIEFLVGSDPAGGYDTYARVLSRHIPKYIPGNPAITVKNQPGAGSARTAGIIARISPKDGTSVGIIFPGVVVGPLLDTKQKWQFDPSEFIYIGSADSGTRVCITFASSKIKTFEDARNNKTIMGASAQGGSTRDYAYMLNHAAGAKFEVVSGYKGSADILLAMERGEIDGLCGLDYSSLKSQRGQWLAEKKINVLIQTAIDAEPDLDRIGVPIVWNYVQREEDRRAVELIVSQQIFGRPFILPPGTNERATNILREAFMKALADKALLAEAEKARIDINPIDGEKVQALVAKLYKLPQSTLDRAQRIIQP